MTFDKATSELVPERITPSMDGAKVHANGHKEDLVPGASALLTNWFAEQVERAPEACALKSESRSLTYAELDTWSDSLAVRLQRSGVTADVLVGICMSRSPEMVVAALAVLKAGGAYLPMDPDYPAERLNYMIQDARVRVVLTTDDMARLMPVDCEKVLVDVRSGAPQHSEKPRSCAVTSDHLAYVIYTSGSTGQPKGVQIPHRGLENLIKWHQRAFSVVPADRASQVASFGFDAAVWEVWPYLAAGASVHFPNDAIRSDAHHLRDWFVKEQVTIGFVPTAMAENLIRLQWPAQCSLRFLLTGADTLRHYPAAGLPFQLVNNYGPTECTVVTTSAIVSSTEDTNHNPPIGRAIDHAQIYVLDATLQPMPIGEVGELYIGGAGLARGYVNQPKQEADCFVTDPSGQRLYKTGDLGVLRADGQIVFIGRNDDQIKIRGYRIEPNEIVTLLNQCPGIDSSVVVARSENDDIRLVAYLVGSDFALSRTGLQEYLRSRLPDYMVPATFVRLDHLPLNSSGKLDRSALPTPTADNTIGDEISAEPRTPVEERVVSILAELLGLEKVSIHDNFFFLGGHSLLGTQLIARARDSFGVELPLRTVFDSPTAAQLSAEIERLLGSERVSAD